MFTAPMNTPLGDMTAASDGRALTGLWFVGQTHYPADAASWETQEDSEVFTYTQRWLDDYFAGVNAPYDMPLAASGTEFQMLTWDMLLETIPYGTTGTYRGIAGKMSLKGIQTSPRAVGSAVAHNPISIIIPCHRILGTRSSLTGYAGGLERKAALLRLEGVPV